MAQKVWTAAELDDMEPGQVEALFKASIVTDLGEAPPEFIQRVRARVQARIDTSESSATR